MKKGRQETSVTVVKVKLKVFEDMRWCHAARAAAFAWDWGLQYKYRHFIILQCTVTKAVALELDLWHTSSTYVRIVHSGKVMRTLLSRTSRVI